MRADGAEEDESFVLADITHSGSTDQFREELHAAVGSDEAVGTSLLNATHSGAMPALTPLSPTDFNEDLFSGENLSGTAGIIGAALWDKTKESRSQYTSKCMPYLTYDYYRDYFSVDNEYVLNKLRLLAFPFRHRNWRRVSDDLDEGSRYMPPKQDINAPDGYIPLMGLLTYVCLMSFMVAAHGEKDFTPEVIVGAFWTAFGIIVFETLLIKLGFYCFAGNARPIATVDAVCYSGYKMLFVNINILAFLMTHSPRVYTVVACLGSACCGYAITKTLRAYTSSVLSADSETGKYMRLLSLGMICLGIAQVGFIFLLGRFVVL